jgi:hypothetical protein
VLPSATLRHAATGREGAGASIIYSFRIINFIIQLIEWHEIE